MKITTDRYGMLTYSYEAGDGVTCSYPLLREVGQPWVREAEILLEKKQIQRVRGFALPFWPGCADFARQDIPLSYLDSASKTKEVFTYTSDNAYWYVINQASHRLYCVGRIGGSRGKGRGINYCDRAKERAAQMNREMRAFYAAKNG